MILNINKSKNIHFIIYAVHLGGALILLALPIPVETMAILFVLALISLGLSRRYESGLEVGTWRLMDDGGCICIDQEICIGRFKIIRASVYTGFISLQLKSVSGRTFKKLIMQDAVGSEQFRALCARIIQGRLIASDQP